MRPSWFAMRPGAQREGGLIRLPLMYLGSEPLTGVRVFVFGAHITGVSSGGGDFDSDIELADLVSGDELRLTIRTDGEPGPLAFTLDLVAGQRHVRKLRVQVPEPVGAPVVTEHPPG